jgi:hypothetical protein
LEKQNFQFKDHIMSFYHENIVWQREDGRWGIGFYKRVSNNSGWNSDYDAEWDDDFDHSQFSFARTGLLTEQQAMNAWHGANPGQYEVIEYKKKNAKEIAEYEDMAKACNNPAYAKERELRKAKEESKALIKRVRERLRQEPPVANRRYYVRFSMSELPSATGMMQDKEFNLTQQGDWLGFETTKTLKSGKTKPDFLKVWNTKTNSQAPNVISIQKAVRSVYYR